MTDLASWLLEQIAEDEREVDLASGGDYCDDRRYFHSADRALSECEAKRRIIDEHAARFDICRICTLVEHPCPTLRILASVYADRPGYLKEWAL
jgi:hypothetical protein